METTSENIVRKISEEFNLMVQMLGLIAALYFESEMGSYFDVTMQWHGQPGELSTRSGFYMLEIHSLLFDFIIPWWEMQEQVQSRHYIDGCD